MKIRDMRDIEIEVTKWEEKLKALQSQFDEEPLNKMKIAIFTNMMPMAIQDFIYTHVEKDTEYDELKEKIRSMVSNKIAVDMGPTPMDVGGIEDGWGDERRANAFGEAQEWPPVERC